MIDYVTFETAVKLKEAGFPQPERLSQYQICYDFRFNFSYCEDAQNGYLLDDHDVFAPRVTDILPYLKGEYHMWYSEASGCFVIDAPVFLSREMFANPNPAECAAEAWLKQNQK